MRSREAQRRAQKKYDERAAAENLFKRYMLKLHTVTDADVISRLDNVENRQGYIKALIRADLKEEKRRIETERELEVMPFDHEFNGELCHATGIEKCFGDPANPEDWWNEYVDLAGEYHYGR